MLYVFYTFACKLKVKKSLESNRQPYTTRCACNMEKGEKKIRRQKKNWPNKVRVHRSAWEKFLGVSH